MSVADGHSVKPVTIAMENHSAGPLGSEAKSQPLQQTTISSQQSLAAAPRPHGGCAPTLGSLWDAKGPGVIRWEPVYWNKPRDMPQSRALYR
jgi:hypothetical protein